MAKMETSNVVGVKKKKKHTRKPQKTNQTAWSPFVVVRTLTMATTGTTTTTRNGAHKTTEQRETKDPESP